MYTWNIISQVGRAQVGRPQDESFSSNFICEFYMLNKPIHIFLFFSYINIFQIKRD